MCASPFAPIWIAPDGLFDGTELQSGMALSVMGGRTGKIVPRASLPPEANVINVAGTLCAGFLDLQVNGGGDALLNNDQSAGTIARMAAAHRRFGTVGILPTVITDAPEVLDRAVDAALAAHGMQGVLGLHIEGPHLSIARRGTHSAQYIRPFESRTLAHVQRLRAAGIFVKITVAPEAVTNAQVAQIVQTGAIVSIGHSDARAEDVRALLAAGANCFTHLFNAMSPMLSRAEGVTGACINSRAYAGIICDGHHVADEMIALAIRARPMSGRMFLVSDAMPTVGGSDHFTLYGQQLHLKGGRLVNAEGALAGAHVTMAEGLARLITDVGAPLATALDMAISAPARLIGKPDLASPAGRDLGDILVLDAQWRPMFLAEHPKLDVKSAFGSDKLDKEAP
jgi:N-acetylglucosamine-6-phosphate deacetylase